MKLSGFTLTAMLDILTVSVDNVITSSPGYNAELMPSDEST